MQKVTCLGANPYFIMRLKYMKKVKIFFSPHLEIEINNF